MSKIKNYFFSLITFLLVVAFICVAGEIIFRLKGDGPDNPLAQITQKNTLYLFEPSTVKHGKSSIEGEFEYDAHINSYGYRGPEFSKEKMPGVTRIMTIGDSFTFGVGAQDNETYAALIEQGLKDKGYKVELINAGIGHASPIRHWDNFLKIHAQYNPDLVLVFLDLTDVWDDWHWERHAIFNKNGRIDHFDLSVFNGKRSWWSTLVHHSAFCKYLNNQIVRTYKKLKYIGVKRYLMAKKDGISAKSLIIGSGGEFSDETVIKFDALFFLRGRQRKSLIDKNWPRTAKYLLKLKEELDKRDIDMVLVMYPHGLFVGADQWAEGRKSWGFEPEQYTDLYPFEVVAAFAKKEGIPFINTLPAFLKAPHAQYFFDYDGHMRPIGNKIVAATVVNDKNFSKIIKAHNP